MSKRELRESELEQFVTQAYGNEDGLGVEELEQVFKEGLGVEELEQTFKDEIAYRASWSGVYLADALELVRSCTKIVPTVVPPPPPAVVSETKPVLTSAPQPAPIPKPASIQARSSSNSAVRRRLVDEACAYMTRIIEEEHGGQIDAEELVKVLELIRVGMEMSFLEVPSHSTVERCASWGGVYTADAIELLREGAAAGL